MKKTKSRIDHVLNRDNGPKIFRIRVPFGGIWLSDTNCYVITDEDDVLIVDTGFASPASKAVLKQHLASLDIDPTRARYLATHLHFDHAGLFKSLTKEGTEIIMSRQAYDYSAFRFRRARSREMQQLMKEEGANFVASRGIAAVSQEARVCDLKGRRYTLLEEGDELNVGRFTFRAIMTPGHTSGDMSMYHADSGTLITGDTALRMMTPGLALPSEGFNPLAAYIESLGKLKRIDPKLVLPGHGSPHDNIKGIVDSTLKRHIKRLVEAYEIVATMPNARGGDIIREMSWKRRAKNGWDKVDGFTRISIAKSGFAYLEYLVSIGEIERTTTKGCRHYHVKQ